MHSPDVVWDYTDRSGGPDACWPWLRSCQSSGYGQINVQGRYWTAHRLAWTVTFGEIPAGMFVCHRCDNPLCCNPSHLWLGSQRENMLDMFAKGRGRLTPAHCPAGHSRADHGIRDAKDGHLRCRECRRLKQRARRAAARR